MKIGFKFWPGPLTIVYKANSNISDIITASSGYVGVRIPNNEFCKNLITEFGKPLSSSSANTHGREIPFCYESIESEIITNVNHVVKYKFPKKVKPSRIVEINGNSIKIVRS